MLHPSVGDFGFGIQKARRRVCLMLSYPSELFFYSQCVCCLSHPSFFSHALQGHIEPGKEQVLKVYYLPGVPGVFCKTFQIQVGHLEPDKISLKGEASFPRICLDLPRNIKGEHCLSAPQEAPPFWGFGFVFPASCHTSIVQLTPPPSLEMSGLPDQQSVLWLLAESLTDKPVWALPQEPSRRACQHICQSPGKTMAGQKCLGKL